MKVSECRPICPATRHKNRGSFEVEEARGRARWWWGKRAGIRFLFAVAFGPVAFSCAAGRQQLKVPEGFLVSAAAVYPFGFKWEEPGYRAFELSQRLVEVGLAANGDLVSYFGPSEFRIIRAEEDRAWVGSTALPLLTRSGVKAEQAVVVRPWAEKRVNTSSQEAEDAKGRARGRSNASLTTYLAHVEVVHPSSGQVILDLHKEFTVDPFEAAAKAAERELDADPDPELTEALEELMREAMGALSRFAVPREKVKELPYTLAITPAEAMRYSRGTEHEARLTNATRDVAASAVFLQTRAMFANPRLPAEAAAKLVGLPPGIYVLSAPAGAPLAPGDLIIGVEGMTALPQILARARLGGTPPQLKVRRARGGEEDVYLP